MPVQKSLETYWRHLVDSPVYVAWCKVLLLDIGFSSATLSIQGSTNSSRHLMLVSVLCLRQCAKMNGGITLSLQVTNPNTMIWTECLLFINMNMNLFSNWYSNTMKSLYWSFRVNAKQYSMLFSNFWRTELHSGAAFLTDSVQLILVCCTEDKTWNKVHIQNQ